MIFGGNSEFSVLHSIHTMKVVMEFALGILFLFIVLLAPTKCVDMVGDRKVQVFLSPKNFQGALDNCRYHGMELLLLCNREEELQAVALARKYKIMEFWLAATDIGHESVFTSAITGEPLTYTNWWGVEPNNGGPYTAILSIFGGVLGFTAENCVNIWIPNPGHHHWNDHKCAKEMRYFCEICDG